MNTGFLSLIRSVDLPQCQVCFNFKVERMIALGETVSPQTPGRTHAFLTSTLA